MWHNNLTLRHDNMRNAFNDVHVIRQADQGKGNPKQRYYNVYNAYLVVCRI